MPFAKFGLHADLLRGISKLNFVQPTEIQRDALPAAIQGRDILACSSTGSGKTAAFVLPILNRLMEKNRGVTRALILTPTRELAAQIDEHLAELAIHTSIKSSTVYGGVSMGPQKRAFQTGADVIVATPGRLLDHFQYSYAQLHGLEVVVLDEADRMLDMGFLPDIRKILKQLPAQRQTLLFSATLPAQIMDLAKGMLKNPVTVNLERKALPATGIRQSVYPVPHHLKAQLFVKLLETVAPRSVLVFTRTKHRTDKLAQFLSKHGISCARIHGGRSQAQRTHAMDGLKHGRYRVLVATDVAARGIDVQTLELVVNFDMPGQVDDYIHRVGRTARAEATGDAFTFVAPNEEGELKHIEKTIGKKLPRILAPDFDYKNTVGEAPDTGMRSNRRGPRNDNRKPSRFQPSSRRNGNSTGNANGNVIGNGNDRQNTQQPGRHATRSWEEKPAGSQPKPFRKNFWSHRDKAPRTSVKSSSWAR